MIKIAIANNKGGDGKTETARRLAIQFARLRQSVIMADLDGQANLTALVSAGVPANTLAHVLRGDCSLAQATGFVYARGGLVPASGDLDDVADDLVTRHLGVMRLKNAIEKAEQDLPYSKTDILLMDCPPNLGSLTFSALIAADYVLIPARPKPHSIAGVKRVLSKVDEVHTALGSGPQLLGIVPTMVTAGRVEQRECLAQLADLGYPMFAEIPMSEDVRRRDTLLNDAYCQVAQQLLAAIGGNL